MNREGKIKNIFFMVKVSPGIHKINGWIWGRSAVTVILDPVSRVTFMDCCQTIISSLHLKPVVAGNNNLPTVEGTVKTLPVRYRIHLSGRGDCQFDLSVIPGIVSLKGADGPGGDIRPVAIVVTGMISGSTITGGPSDKRPKNSYSGCDPKSGAEIIVIIIVRRGSVVMT